MDIWKSVGGMITAELTDAEKERTLARLNDAGIVLYQLESTGELTAKMRIRRGDFAKAQKLVARGGGKLQRIQDLGLYWSVRNLLRRPILLSGIGLVLALTLFLPTRVLFVRVDGNQSVPARQILAEAEACGISFGASRSKVRSERVKNQLLERLPQLQWAGINTAGCVATVSVRERPTETDNTPDTDISGIAADRDGYILSMTVTAGTPMVQVGQAVKKDQLLISSYTDCGLCIRAQRAEGEVLAQTSRMLDAVTPARAIVRRAEERVRRRVGILFGKKRINLWKDSGICDTTCGRMYAEHSATLPGGFVLPFKIWVEEWVSYTFQVQALPQDRAEVALTEFSDRYLVSQMVAGEILEAKRNFCTEPELYRLEGRFLCREMLGKRQQERIGAIYGEDN